MMPNNSHHVNQDPGRQQIARLRQLRSDARRLHSSLVKDLAPFKEEDNSFRTWPDKHDDKISVATTATAMMALITSNKHREVFGDDSTLAALFKSLVEAEWRSSALPDKNAFTTSMAVRAYGLLVRADVLDSKAGARLKHVVPDTKRKETLQAIIKAKASAGESSFKVEDYPSKTAMGYWFVDGTIGAGIKLKLESWRRIADWAAKEFHRELIYVSAGNDSLMDPPSLAMAACLINRIRRHCAHTKELVKIARNLPSPVELRFGIEQVFEKQSDSGIWHKYFPLFHFPGGKGAADYCFSFEFLEAILIEFGKDILRKPELLDGLERAVRWCDKYRLAFQHQQKLYRGWNSGGEVKNLAAGKPESWATASVHMFLSQLEKQVNELLDELVLRRFECDRAAVIHSSERLNKRIIDVNLTFPDEKRTTLLSVIRSEVIAHAPETDGDPLYKPEIPVPRSALLFGPPGTSKTNLAKAVAEALGWPLIVITPSEFLGKGLEQVHAQVDEVFEDLMDLSYAVVFFDEMDALAQTRGGEDTQPAGNATDAGQRVGDEPAKVGGDLDVTRQLLTTSMLPKLANLWDQKRVIFLMATNHRQQLDPAITRPSRFDLLLCVASPTWKNKIAPNALKNIFSIQNADKVSKELSRLTADDQAAIRALDRFTVTEVGIFLDHLRRIQGQSELAVALSLFKPLDFKTIVMDWAQKNITLREESMITAEHKQDLKGSRRQYYPKQK